MNKNRFAGADFDDSDDDVAVQKTTKTQKKKEERKISDKPVKVNTTKMAEGGFEVVSKDPAAKTTTEGSRGGRGGRGGERGGRGGRGGDRGGRGGRGGTRRDADGNLVGAGDKPRERRPFTGKAREEGHPMDRQSGMGRGRKPREQKDGHGKGNWGDKADTEFKQKGTPVEEEEKVVEEKKPEEPKVIIKEEVIGVSMDDFLGGRSRLNKKEAREAEGVKGAKVAENT